MFVRHIATETEDTPLTEFHANSYIQKGTAVYFKVSIAEGDLVRECSCSARNADFLTFVNEETVGFILIIEIRPHEHGRTIAELPAVLNVEIS